MRHHLPYEILEELLEQRRKEFVRFSIAPTEEFDPCGTRHTAVRRADGRTEVHMWQMQGEALGELGTSQVEELNNLLRSARASGDYNQYGQAVAGMVVGYAKSLAEDASESRITFHELDWN